MKKSILCFAIVLSWIFSSVVYAQWAQCGTVNAGAIRSLIYVEPNIFVCTSGGGVYKSTDEGNTFRPSKTGLLSANVWGIAKFGDSLFAYSENGVFVADKDASLWRAIKSGLPKEGVVYATSHKEHLIASSTKSGCYVWNNTTEQWKPINSGLPADPIWNLMDFGSMLFAATSTKGVYATRDLGESWFEANGSTLPPIVTSLCVYKNQIIAGEYTLGAYATIDTGKSWIKLNTGIDSVATLVTKVLGEELFLCAESGLFQFDSTNRTWKDVSNGLTSKIVVDVIATKKNLFLGLFNGTIWRRPKSELMTVSVENMTNDNLPTPTLYSWFDNTSNVIRTIARGPDCYLTRIDVVDVAGRIVASKNISQESRSSDDWVVSAEGLQSEVYGCIAYTNTSTSCSLVAIVR